MWMVSGKRGNSSLDQWKHIIAPVIEALQQMEWLSDKLIHIVADREFASPKLAEWLKTTYINVDATLRIKASMYLSSTDLPETETKVASLIQKEPIKYTDYGLA